MKRLISAALLLVASPAMQAQKHVYEDLLVMYVDENYEKCLGKAEGYTLNDNTKKDPLPYLYMSMCLYEMSKIEKYQADYPKAARDAVKWAEKYRKKDKEKEFFGNYEDYWAELNTLSMEQGENMYEEGSYSKAKSMFDGMTGYYPENAGAWMMLALSQYKSNLVKEGDLSMKEYVKAYAGIGDIAQLPADQKNLLKNALMRYSTYRGIKGMKDSARATINVGKDHFMDDAEYKMMIEEQN
ncbi:MAG: hypothetical protein IPG69_11840 [Flavobacteriales bacterium]|nr:hypothetical protein [Flavobacteriales bacterium]